MSDQNLEYTLNVMVDDADKRIKALFASWEKLASNMASSFGKAMADAAKGNGAGGFDKLAENAEKSISGMKKLTEATKEQSAAMGASDGMTSKAIGQLNSLWTSADKADISLRRQAETFRSLGNSGAAEALEKMRTELMNMAQLDAQRIGTTGTALPRLNVTQFLAENRVVLQGMDEQIKKESEVAKVSANAHAERIAMAEKFNTTETRLRAERYKGDAEYQAANIAQNKATADFLNSLKAKSVGMTKAQIEAEIVQHQRLAAASIASAQESAQGRVNAEFASVTAMNKTAMAAFAVQQAIEDYSYAGLRGSMNNLSMLAMMIGGSGGIAALFGVMTLNIMHTSGALDGFAESLGLAGIKTEKQKEQIKSLVDTIQSLKDMQFDYETKISEFNPAKSGLDTLQTKDAELRNSIRLEKDRASAAADAVSAYEKMLEISRKLGAAAEIGPFDVGLYNETPETLLKEMEQIKERIKTKMGPMPTGLLTREASLGLLEQLGPLEKQFQQASGMMVSEEAFKAVQKESQEANNKVLELNSSLRLTTEQLKIMESLGKSKYDMKDLLSSDLSASDSAPSGFAGKQLSSFINEEKKNLKKAQSEVTYAYNTDMLEAQGNTEKLTELTKAYIAEMEKVRAASDGNVKNFEAQATVLDATLKQQKDIEDSLNKQINATERLIEKSEKNLQVIQEQKSAWEDTHAANMSAMDDKIDDAKASEKKKSITEGLKNDKESAKAQLDYLKEVARYRYEQMKMENGNGKGDLDPDNQLQSQYNKYLSNLQREYDAYVNNLEKKAEADKKYADKVSEDSKKKRLEALKGELGGEAQDFSAKASQLKGEKLWEQARSELDKAEKALKELYAAQQKAVGDLSSQEAEKMKKDAEATSKKLMQLYDQKAEIEKGQQEQAKAQMMEQKGLLQETVNKKAEAASINLIDPEELVRLQGISSELSTILAKMQAIQAVQAAGASRVPVGGATGGGGAGPFSGGAGGGGFGGGGGGGGPWSPDKASITVNIANNVAGTAHSASMAAVAAAQNLLTLRS